MSKLISTAASKAMNNSNQTGSATKIQSIFNDTAQKIQNLFVKNIMMNSKSGPESVSIYEKPDNDSPRASGVPSPSPSPSPSCDTSCLVSSAEIIPILQTFLLDIQIYHTQMFNGIVNSVSARPHLSSEDLAQPQVTAKWQSEVDTSNSSPLQGFIMEDFANEKVKWHMECERVKKIDSSARKNSPPSYTVANQETRRHWGSRSSISIPSQSNDAKGGTVKTGLETQFLGNDAKGGTVKTGLETQFLGNDAKGGTGTVSTHNSDIPGVPQSNYDDFLKNYTKEYVNYTASTGLLSQSDASAFSRNSRDHPLGMALELSGNGNSTCVEDSSDSENDETWKSLYEYVESTGLVTGKISHEDTVSTIKDEGYNSGLTLTSSSCNTQCCARLSKFMKYHIIDFPEDFLDSYPPDTYIENNNVFGNPCYNKVSEQDVAAGIYFCKEHQFDVGIEDIRQPRPNTNLNASHPNDDIDIVFTHSGYTNNNEYTTTSTPHIDEGFDYYNDFTRVNSGFTEGHQCCARLNKFRKYDITQEPDGFLETYPSGVYIENGYIYGTACQNMYSDESAKAGIKYCVFHQSDPYVENICEPRGVLNRPIRSNKSGAEEVDMLGLTEVTINSRNKSDNTKHIYEWDKYNNDFNYPS